MLRAVVARRPDVTRALRAAQSSRACAPPFARRPPALSSRRVEARATRGLTASASSRGIASSRGLALSRGLASSSSSSSRADEFVPAALAGLDYIGTVAFAASGTLVAGAAGMDVLGCSLVGTITSLGGGTVRDLLLGRTPVFWFRAPQYLLICLGTALTTFYAADALEGEAAQEALWWGDTLGIGAFSVVGAQAAAAAGMSAKGRREISIRRADIRLAATPRPCTDRSGLFRRSRWSPSAAC